MMKLYLLFLLNIIVTCQANEVSSSRQVNAYSGHRKNDLNQGAYLDEGGGRGDRSVGRTACDGCVYVVRTRGLYDDVGRVSKPSRGDNVRSPNNESDATRASGQGQGVHNKNHKASITRAHKIDKDPFVWKRARFDDSASDGHVIRQTRSQPIGESGVNQATFVGRTNDLGEGANALRSSDLNRARSYGQENYLNGADGFSQADYARTNLGPPVPVTGAGNYLNNLDGVAQGLNVKRTSYFDRSAPIVRAVNYGPYNWIYKPRPDLTKSEPQNDISTSDSIRSETQMSRHGYSHPDPIIERKQQEQYVPSLLVIAERSAIEDSNNMKGINLPSFDPNHNYSLLSDTNGNPNDGYDAPYDGYGINDSSQISNPGPNNGYGGVNYNMLAPDFDSFPDRDVNSLSKNKITNSTLIAAYNDTNDQNIYNNTDQKTISDRGRFFDDNNGYTVDHHGFLNTGTLFSDDITKNDGTPDVFEINSNNDPINSNGECYCTTNNGHRVCNCDLNHCEGANCHRVVTQSQTTPTTTCELCKARETTTLKPFVCDLCKQPRPPPPPPPPPRPPPPPLHTGESSCECKQSYSCGCTCCKSESSGCRSEISCCKHSSSSCCKHSCHSCKPKRPSCNNCESGQDFGNNYGENGNNYYGKNGINYYGENENNYNGENGINYYGENENNYNGENGINYYEENENNYNGENGINYYGENENNYNGENGINYYEENENNYNGENGINYYGENENNYNGENGINYYGGNGNNYYEDNDSNAYNDYYKNQAAAEYGGSAGGQFDTNVQGNGWAGAYAGEGGQISGRGNKQSGSSGGTVALYADTDFDDTPISSNAGSIMSNVAGSNKSKSNGGTGIKSSSISIKSSGGSVKIIGGKSSSSTSAYSGSTAYGGGGGNPYNHFFSSFSKTGIFPNNPMMGPFGR